MRRWFVFVIALIIGASVGLPQLTTAQDDVRCFAETGKCISGTIRAYWEQNGGLETFGFPITDVVTERNAEGFIGPTQWFQRDRLEDHGLNDGGVLAGRLGALKLALEGRPWENLAKVPGAAAGCRFFPETGHSLCPPFRAYWERNGGLPRFGFPISEPLIERNADGWTGTTQWFERRRMESHTENQPPFDILLGLLGKEVRDLPAATPTPQPMPTPNPCTGVPDPTSGTIQPGKCVTEGTVILMGITGFQPNEDITFSLTAPDNSRLGTIRTVNIGPTGSVEGLAWDTRGMAPGLWHWDFQGTVSGHQAIVYFKVLRR